MAEPSNPSLRAQIIGEVIKVVAEVPQSVTYSMIFERVLASTGLREEQVSMEIMRSAALLIRSGLLRCNSHDPMDGSIAFGSDTVLVAGADLLSFIWRDEVYAAGNDDSP